MSIVDRVKSVADATNIFFGLCYHLNVKKVRGDEIARFVSAGQVKIVGQL